MSLYAQAFQAITNTTAPAFMATASDVAVLYSIESTGLREWQFPTSRVVRLAEAAGVEFWVKFGTSDSVAASSNSLMFLGGAAELHRITAGQSHFSIVSTATVTVNVTLGYGQ